MIMPTLLPDPTAKVDKKTQDLLAQATVLSRISSINSFVLNAAVEKANHHFEQAGFKILLKK